MSRPRDDRQDDLFRPPLEEIINLRHPLVRLSSVCRVGPGQPPLPTRLVAGLFILKHMHNLCDQALCERWVENPYFQYFCGEGVAFALFGQSNNHLGDRHSCQIVALYQSELA
jgi:transposase, IS5 family